MVLMSKVKRLIRYCSLDWVTKVLNVVSYDTVVSQFVQVLLGSCSAFLFD